MLVTVEDTGIALFNVAGAIFAVDDFCVRCGASLAAGKLKGTEVACSGCDWRYDVTTGRLQTGRGAHNFWPKGDGRHWFLTNRVEGTISLIDTQAMMVVASIRVPGGPDCMDITPDGKELWVTQRFLRRIAIVDLATLKVTGSIPVGKSPHGVFILKAPVVTPPPLRAASSEPDPK